MANIPNQFYPGSMPNTDPRTARIIGDAFDRLNFLTTELDNVKQSIIDQTSNLANAQTPIPGVMNLPGPNGYGSLRVSPDGVIQSYVNPQTYSFNPSMKWGGSYYTNVVSTATSGVANTNTHSFVITGNTLAINGDALEIDTEWFIDNVNGATVTIQYGGTTVTTYGIPTNANVAYRLRITLVRITGTTLRFASLEGDQATVFSKSVDLTTGVNNATNQTIQFQAQQAVSGTTTQRWTRVRFDPSA